ncbi:hypothetical protein NOCA1190024 [metagenome]|uniref:Uncharacterized protein n=1 Tax=metagenome TaxID=256318 RepID=A0A2P2CCE5_9ZZZZ
MDIFAVITGSLGLALSMGLAAREVWRSRRETARRQVEAVSVTAEFVGIEGKTPVCRVICHNKSQHAVTDVYAYVVWEATTEWPDGSIAPTQCVDLIGFHGVAPESRVERVEVLKGQPAKAPSLIPGPFPVKFTLTDASRVRWQRGLDGKLRKNPVEMLGNRLSEAGPDGQPTYQQRRRKRSPFD